jgi:hypothetical protein
MWLWQLCWFAFTLIISTGLLLSIGAFVFIIVRKLSKKFLSQPRHHVDILFAGTVMLALSQLFGPLFAASYPLVLGPDASDYSLSFQSMYLNLSYNSTSGNYTIMSTTDSSGEYYGYINESKIRVGDKFYIDNTIFANNLNPFMSYDNQIFLNITPPYGVTVFLSRPVINVGQRSDIIVEFTKIIPDPGPYL